jgi:hypothetical protein
MPKSISRTEKRGRGRPATNPTSIHLTLAPEPLAEVDDWIERQKEPYSRPEAIRRLVELGLTVKSLPKQTSRARAAKANAMAGKQLDDLVDASASADQQATRKRHLLSGPEEFQRVRIDRPAKKK